MAPRNRQVVSRSLRWSILLFLTGVMVGATVMARLSRSVTTPASQNPAGPIAGAPVPPPSPTVAIPVSGQRAPASEITWSAVARSVYDKTKRQTLVECQAEIDRLLSEQAGEPFREFQLMRLKAEVSRDNYQNWSDCAARLQQSLAALQRVKEVMLLAEMNVRNDFGEALNQTGRRAEALDQFQAVLDLEPEAYATPVDPKISQGWLDQINDSYLRAATHLVSDTPIEELARRNITLSPFAHLRLGSQSRSWKLVLEDGVKVDHPSTHKKNRQSRDWLQLIVREGIIEPKDKERLEETIRFLDSVIDRPRNQGGLNISISDTPSPYPKLSGPPKPQLVPEKK